MASTKQRKRSIFDGMGSQLEDGQSNPKVSKLMLSRPSSLLTGTKGLTTSSRHSTPSVGDSKVLAEGGTVRNMVNDQCDSVGCKHFLPDDIIASNILPRIPSEVLHSWRFACKQWFHWMYNEPTFLDAQLAKSKRRFIFDVYVQESYHKQWEVDIVFDNITKTVTFSKCHMDFPNKLDWIEDEDDKFTSNSCNGLILLNHLKHENLLCVVNPVTKQWVSLPQCNHDVSCVGLGYDLFSKKYKVIIFFRELSHRLRMMHNGCQVLTLGTQTWRPMELPCEYFWDLDRPISVGRYLHFRYKSWDRPSKLKLRGLSGKPFFYNEIASVDIVNETCRVTKPPDSVKAFKGPFNLFTVGESLALAPDPSESHHMEIWVLDDCSKGQWSKRYSIAKDLLCRLLPDLLQPIATLNGGEVVIYEEYRGLRLFYSVVGSGIFREIETPWKTVHSFGDPAEDPPTSIKVFDRITTLASPHKVASN